MTARGPDPDRFVDCRRLVLGVDMAEIPGRRSFDETGPLSEEATNKRCLLRQTSQTPRGLDKMWVARAVGFEPTIPDLETGALDQAKLRPYRCRYIGIGPWEPSRTAVS